jgi:hypothetical protein
VKEVDQLQVKEDYSEKPLIVEVWYKEKLYSIWRNFKSTNWSKCSDFVCRRSPKGAGFYIKTKENAEISPRYGELRAFLVEKARKKRIMLKKERKNAVYRRCTP